MNSFNIEIGSKIHDIAHVHMGQSYFPIVFANVGSSSPQGDIKDVVRMAKLADVNGADAVAELSLRPDAAEIRKQLISEIRKPISAVSVYDSYVRAQNTGYKISPLEIVKDFERMALQGVDIITIHATVFLEDIKLIKESKRIIKSTSRGGAMMLHLMREGQYENPYFTMFDDILDIASKYNVSISLGPAYRTGAVSDSLLNGDLDSLEIDRMALLVEKAKQRGVPVMVEGIGHTPIDRISEIVPSSILKCHSAPYRVLTVATDISLGYDHISSAIASATAVYNGASSITAISRDEHIGLPADENMIEGIISARIAAHCGYIARNKDYSKDHEMAVSRAAKGCLGNPGLSIVPLMKSCLVNQPEYAHKKSCNMCGDFCPYEIFDKIGV